MRKATFKIFMVCMVIFALTVTFVPNINVVKAASNSVVSIAQVNSFDSSIWNLKKDVDGKGETIITKDSSAIRLVKSASYHVVMHI